MKTKFNFAIPFLLGVGITIASIISLGAATPATPEKTANDRDTQVVALAGGLAIMLAINDHTTDTLYLYQVEEEKEGGKEEGGKDDKKKNVTVTLSGSIDLSATGKDQLPSSVDMK